MYSIKYETLLRLQGGVFGPRLCGVSRPSMLAHHSLGKPRRTLLHRSSCSCRTSRIMCLLGVLAAQTIGYSSAANANDDGWQRVGSAVYSSPATVSIPAPVSTDSVQHWQEVGSTPVNTYHASSPEHQPGELSLRHGGNEQFQGQVQPVGAGASADEWLQTGVAKSAPDTLPELDDAMLIIPVDANDNTSEQPLAVGATSTVNLDLFVGQVSVLGKVDVSRVAVGNGAIIRAQVLDTGELLVIAAASGSSSLRLWNKDNTQTDYNIRVAQSDPETRVPLQRMVRMRVRMVEFRKSALGRLGIDWSDSAGGPALAAAAQGSNNLALRPATAAFDVLSGPHPAVSAYFGIASNITSKINLLAQNGDAVTLAEPILSAMNGGQASFLAGGEVPYPSIGENGQTQVEFKEYGIKLDVAPLIDGAGNVRTVLETEISQLDESVSVQGTPGLLTRRAQTEVTVRSGETIVISGLLSSESGADEKMIPGLGRLPIVGRLFGSKSRRNSVNELVIFVTPEVIEPGAAMISPRERLYLDASERRVDDLRQQLQLMD